MEIREDEPDEKKQRRVFGAAARKPASVSCTGRDPPKGRREWEDYRGKEGQLQGCADSQFWYGGNTHLAFCFLFSES